MKRFLSLSLIAVCLGLNACNKKPAASSDGSFTEADFNIPAGPREGNHYKVFFKVLRQNSSPAVGFKVDAWVKGKSADNEKRTKTTNANGMLTFDDLPFPEAKNPLVAVLHYYNGKPNDEERDITYPYIDSDAMRLKDTQYIPNNATPEPAK